MQTRKCVLCQRKTDLPGAYAICAMCRQDCADNHHMIDGKSQIIETYPGLGGFVCMRCKATFADNPHKLPWLGLLAVIVMAGVTAVGFYYGCLFFFG